MKGQGSWLRLLIGLGVSMLILFALVKVGGVGIISQRFRVSGSAGNLLNAIEKVDQCVKENEAGGAECWEVVNVSMPQRGRSLGHEDDPVWIIFYGGDYKKGDIEVIEAEIDLGIENEDIKNDKCPDGICYGLIKRHVTEDSKIKLEEEILEKLRPFWFISPCFAEVKVYYDRGRDEIRICKVRETKGGDNFCWDPDIGEDWSSWLDTHWPNKAKEDWSCPQYIDDFSD